MKTVEHSVQRELQNAGEEAVERRTADFDEMRHGTSPELREWLLLA
jgi:hypothetical protein